MYGIKTNLPSTLNNKTNAVKSLVDAKSSPPQHSFPS